MFRTPDSRQHQRALSGRMDGVRGAVQPPQQAEEPIPHRVVLLGRRERVGDAGRAESLESLQDGALEGGAPRRERAIRGPRTLRCALPDPQWGAGCRECSHKRGAPCSPTLASEPAGAHWAPADSSPGRRQKGRRKEGLRRREGGRAATLAGCTRSC